MDDPNPDEHPGFIVSTIQTALLPLHAAVSKPAQRAYLGTFLFAATSILLLCVSSVAYTLFYYSYVPQNSVERVLHLQFGSDHHPHGTAHLSTTLSSLQPYDISLSLHLPRTPSNLLVGNFMLDLSLLGPLPSLSYNPTTTTTTTTNNNNNNRTLAHSRRPAILTYTSPVVATASTLTHLPFYLLGFESESETLTIPMFESVTFPKGRANIPRSAALVVEAWDTDADADAHPHHQKKKMQFYSVTLRIIAKLGGLRWLLYHHRVLSFLFFTTAFWSSSMLSMALAWFAVSTYLGPSSMVGVKTESNEEGAIKRERSSDDDEDDEDPSFDPTSLEDLSDTSRTFPTLGRRQQQRRGQTPLRFAGRNDVVKREEEIKREEDQVLRQPLPAEADDEEDDDDDDNADEFSQGTSGFRDSGIGTGRDEERLASVQRRRKASMMMNGRES